MITTTKPDTVSFGTKGQVVIPSRLRKEFEIEEGTRAVVQATPEGILLKPITAPTIRPDGSLLQKRGYDRETGLLYLPNEDYPEIHNSPSLDDAISARDRLLEVVQDFPFAKPHHRSAWLSGLLTCLARHAIFHRSDGDFPAGNLAHPRQGLHQFGLAITLYTRDTQDFSSTNIEADSMQRL